MAGRFPSALAWQLMHVGSVRPRANAWQVKHSVELDGAAWWAPPRSFAWHFTQTAVPGFLNPSRSKSWQSWHSAFSPPT
jgi:hypothetical protein